MGWSGTGIFWSGTGAVYNLFARPQTSNDFTYCAQSLVIQFQ